MQANISDWTHVAVGNWNLAILNPQWLSENVFAKEPIEVEMMLGGPTPLLRYHREKVTIIPSPSQLVVAAREATEEALTQASLAMCRILELLPVTPVTAVGINFGYRQQNVDATVANLFMIPDTDKIADADFIVFETSITRVFEYDDGKLSFRLNLQDGNLTAHFNFHKAVEPGQAAWPLLSERAVPFMKQSQKFLNDIYTLEMEE